MILTVFAILKEKNGGYDLVHMPDYLLRRNS